MASTKRISSFIFDRLISVVARRGFATRTQGSASEIVNSSEVAMMKKAAGEESKKSGAWVPDPVTGYYEPEGQTNLQAEEHHELQLEQKNRPT